MADEDIGIPEMYPTVKDDTFYGGSKSSDGLEFIGGAPDRLSLLEKTVTDLLDTYKDLIKCTGAAEERMRRLEGHAASLRASILHLTHKIDVQTGFKSK
ncbi:imv surface protein, fusion protein [Pteropox virus]|uniref:Imv surface protein, fusion protein n=1 Tax=Pteropox virus TaxID=1873698 RepID=A0A1B1MRG5_9POXV|nr:imv surface protein, fusion protein [Pteropox virus]ANS71206.1 imv surface protein, fusion protein [Pteropox virus]